MQPVFVNHEELQPLLLSNENANRRACPTLSNPTKIKLFIIGSFGCMGGKLIYEGVQGCLSIPKIQNSIDYDQVTCNGAVVRAIWGSFLLSSGLIIGCITLLQARRWIRIIEE